MDKLLLIKIVYGAASLQGLFMAILLARTKVNQPANRILSVLLLLISFHLVLVGFDERSFFLTFPHLSRVSWVIGALYGPLIFLYVQAITHTLPKPIWKTAWLILPFLVVVIAVMPYFLLDAGAKREYLRDFETASLDDFGWVNQFVSLMHLVFAVLCLVYYLRLERKRLQEYTSLESTRIMWLKNFLLVFLGAVLTGIIPFFAKTWNVPVLSDFYHFHFIGVVILFYWLSFNALTQPVIFGLAEEVPTAFESRPTDSSEEKYGKSRLDHVQLESILARVRSAIEQDQLFLKSNLTLSDLAMRTHLSKHQISQAINSLHAGNFFDLVNDYRVEEFKRRALSPEYQHLSQLGIALESGFNSKATFYAVFKKKTGLTPAEFVSMSSAPLVSGPTGLD